MTTQTQKLADEFNRYFTSANDVDVPARVSVSRDEWRELYAAIKRDLPQQDTKVKFGCYCDLEPHMQPDGCVIDVGKPENCVYANRVASKNDCKYWLPITVETNAAYGILTPPTK